MPLLGGGYVWLSTALSIAFLNMSSWPYVVLHLTTTCLYWGVCLTVYCLVNCIPQHVKLTLCSTALDHQMPLPSRYLWLYSAFSIAFFQIWSWPDIVLLLTTIYLYWGGASGPSAKRTSAQFELISGLGLASQRSFLRKTKKFSLANIKYNAV